MTKIEEVARAIWGASSDAYNHWDALDEVERQAQMQVARAAIEAMLEPAPEMVRYALWHTTDEATEDQRDIAAEAIAGMPPLDPRRQRDGINAAIDVVRDWQAMITASLQEGEGK
jgi:hypothetical protein